MSLCKNLNRMALQVRSKPGLALAFVLMLICAEVAISSGEYPIGGNHHAIRRLDCSVFCRKTGFSGYVGGCQCGFTLFANKRSHFGSHGHVSHVPYLQSPSAFERFYAENSLSPEDDSAEETSDTRQGVNFKNRQITSSGKMLNDNLE